MKHSVFQRPRRIARAAGLLYLAEMNTGAISLFALGRIVVAGNATATAANIRTHEQLLAGLIWLVFLWPPLAESLFKYVVLAALGELSLAIWLVAVGVDEHAWNQAAA